MRRRRELRLALERAHDEHPLPSLRHAVVSGEDDALGDVVAEMPTSRKELLEPRRIVVFVGKPEHVLEKERLRSRLIEYAQVVIEKACLGIPSGALVLEPVAGLRERRARWSP